MIVRKIVGNLLLALLAPIILQMTSIPNVYRAVFWKQYRYSDSELGSLSEFLAVIYHEYFFFYLVSLVLFLLPFQLVKDYFTRKGKQLSIARKFFILLAIMLIVILFLGSFVLNIWRAVWYQNFFYLAISVVFSGIFATLLHFFVDRYEKN